MNQQTRLRIGLVLLIVALPIAFVIGGAIVCAPAIDSFNINRGPDPVLEKQGYVGLACIAVTEILFGALIAYWMLAGRRE